MLSPSYLLSQLRHWAINTALRWLPTPFTLLHPFRPIMDEDEFGAGPSEWFRKCLCKKVFHQLNSYTTHIKSCQQYKTSAGATLQEAKIRYRARKSKSGKNREVPKSWDDDDDLGIDYTPPIPPGPSSASEGQTPQTSVQAEAEILLTPDGPPSVRQPCLSLSPQLFGPHSLSGAAPSQPGRRVARKPSSHGN